MTCTRDCLLRFTALGTRETPTTAHFIARLAAVLLPDARTAMDLTPGNGCFFSEHVPIHLTMTVSPHDFTALPYTDHAFDAAFFDPPHLGDLGVNSIMRARYGTLNGSQVKQLIQSGVAEAWRITRVGLVIKVTEHCHGQRFQAESIWVESVLGEPYERLHVVRRNYAGARSHPQLSAYSNGATFLVYRRGDQRHARRGLVDLDWARPTTKPFVKTQVERSGRGDRSARRSVNPQER
jgi:hypothetical protein